MKFNQRRTEILNKLKQILSKKQNKEISKKEKMFRKLTLNCVKEINDK